MEQEEEQGSLGSAVEDDAPPQKRGGRKVDNSGFKIHFRQTDERVVSGTGKSNGTYYGICLHCESYATERRNRIESMPSYINGNKHQRELALGQIELLRPKKVPRNKRDCYNHLNNCSHYKKHMKTLTTTTTTTKDIPPSSGAAAAA